MAKYTSNRHEARVVEVQQDLKDASLNMRSFSIRISNKNSSYPLLPQRSRSTRKEAQGHQREIHQIKRIADGKRYLLQCLFVGKRFVFLTRVWHSPIAFADLPKSVADATRHYASQEADAELWLFRAQFQAPKQPLLVSDLLQHLMELHRMAELGMKDRCIKLWPTKMLSSSYFSLVWKMIIATPQIDILKHPICIEGARMAFAKTVVLWPKLKPTEMAIGPPPLGKEHRRRELYFPIVMDGAWVIETQCSKDAILE
ncbi:hypothetical protein ZWY2020_020180 [Hordeum vulgare]|nr:hypothetical protein ZWY2020_020180 [Hordeum vulgare]